MLIGYAIKYIGLPSVFSLPYYIFIPFNYLVILFQVKRKLEIRKDILYKKVLIPLIILTTLLNGVLFYFSNVPISCCIILSVINIVELILMRPKYEIVNANTQKYIDEYFENKNK